MAAEPGPRAERGRGPQPVVRLPRAGLPGGAIAGLALVLALMLFVALELRRRHAAARLPVAVESAFPPAPVLAVPLEPTPAPAATPPYTVVTEAAPRVSPRVLAPSPPPLFVAPPPMPPPSPLAPTERAAAPARAEPALVLDVGAGEGSAVDGTAAPASGPQARGGANSGAGDDTPIRATVIHNRATVMPAGTIIPITLETPIDTGRPGLVRAIVSEDARGFDGKRILIPRGSRLIGDYDADVRSSQNRVLVTWTRLIRPDGVAIRIGSPAADALGGAGVPGRLNTFFFRRFVGAVLQSALTVGVNLASRPGNGSVIVGVPSSGVGTIGQDLNPGADLKPKITVKQGAMLNVFVAHDLDFTGAPYKPVDDGR